MSLQTLLDTLHNGNGVENFKLFVLGGLLGLVMVLISEVCDSGHFCKTCKLCKLCGIVRKKQQQGKNVHESSH